MKWVNYKSWMRHNVSADTSYASTIDILPTDKFIAPI